MRLAFALSSLLWPFACASTREAAFDAADGSLTLTHLVALGRGSML
jgi:hypothetical protein